MKIVAGGLDDERVIALLRTHLETARANTSPGTAHALDLTGLRAPDIVFFSAWDGTTLLGVSALKVLSESHGELKSMHTTASARRRGVGTALLDHVVAQARSRGLKRLSLETGSWDYFAPARALYARSGFEICGPFGEYRADPSNVFMTKMIAR